MKKWKHNTGSDDDTWKPFLDIMTGLALVFFLLLIVLSTISTISERQLRAENITLQKESTLAKGEIDKLREGLLKIASMLEPDNQTQDLNEIVEHIQTLTEERAKLADLAENINKERANIYEEIVTKLKEGLKSYKMHGSSAADNVQQEGTRIIINTEYSFASGESELNTETYVVAKRIGSVMLQILQKQEKSGQTVKIGSIEIVGHTDNVDSHAYNRTLGAERSAAFVNAMLAGVKENGGYRMVLLYGCYFKSSSMSFFEPIAGTTDKKQTKKERAKNRRIEIKINFTDDDFYKLLSQHTGIETIPD